jgi:hypothetical protein
MDVTGSVHPSNLGHAAIADQIEAEYTNTEYSGDLPTRLTNCAEFEVTPIIRLGTDNDGETGTWTTAGTGRTSSTADSTITWTGTFRSFGIDNNSVASGVLSWQVDGGTWTNYTLTTTPVLISADYTLGSHTVVIKVISGTVRINEFHAI